MGADRATCERILAKVPQKPPFRFVDEILEMDETHIVGAYRFREDEYFYQGHFPGLPVTPGVILVETMAQTGVVAFGLYLAEGDAKMGRILENAVTLFSLADQVEFTGVVRPGEQVVISGKKVYFRGSQLKVACSMARPNGEVVCTGTLAGKAIPRAQFAELGNSNREEKNA
ncbi:MAG: beta-hydroxyacyl-ACP dehydratase [Deltaproteobacteria bacterium]|nr:beta-hydroxyacyl-ACP dehydratase [Deltaproteobacteria bacterium]